MKPLHGDSYNMANLRSDVRLIKWSQALLIGGVASLIIKAFVA